MTVWSTSRSIGTKIPFAHECRGLSRTTSKVGVITVEDISKSVHAIILAGGSADNPLARYRAMPAVELGEVPLVHAWSKLTNTACLACCMHKNILMHLALTMYKPEVATHFLCRVKHTAH